MVKQFIKKEDIEKIVAIIKKFSNLHFTEHYWIGIVKRNISHDFVLEIFPKFELIVLVEKETLKYGNIGYELFYSLDKARTLAIAVCPDQKKNRIEIIHAVLYHRKVEKKIKEAGFG